MVARAPSQPIDLDDITVEQSQLVPNRRHLQSLNAIGASLAVALAATISVSVLTGVDFQSNSAQISPQDASTTNSNEDEGFILSRGATLPFLVPLPPSSTPSLRPSLSPSESVRPSMLPSTFPTTSSAPSVPPSWSPSRSVQPSLSFQPTHSSVPTLSTKPSTSTSPSAMPSYSPTPKPTNLNKFRLRLHWQPGYYWQESHDESWFCLACATCESNLFSSSCNLQKVCEEGMLLAVARCDPDKDHEIPAVEFRIRNNLFEKKDSGDMISLHQSNLCIASKRRDVFLEKCTGDKSQKWNGFDSLKEFELQPAGKKGDKCLTQHHHPKKGERVFAEKCETARKTKTSFWIAY